MHLRNCLSGGLYFIIKHHFPLNNNLLVFIYSPDNISGLLCFCEKAAAEIIVRCERDINLKINTPIFIKLCMHIGYQINFWGHNCKFCRHISLKLLGNMHCGSMHKFFNIYIRRCNIFLL